MRGARHSAEGALGRLVAMDARFHEAKGDPAGKKKDRALRELVRILDEGKVRHAVIGGIDVQLWESDLHTTLGIAIALDGCDDLPRSALEAAGFQFRERHEHGENWIALDDTPVQFTTGPEFASAISNADLKRVCDGDFRIASTLDLVRAKLHAAADTSRRPSKRLQDLADAAALIEDDPSLDEALSADEKNQIHRGL